MVEAVPSIEAKEGRASCWTLGDVVLSGVVPDQVKWMSALSVYHGLLICNCNITAAWTGLGEHLRLVPGFLP